MQPRALRAMTCVVAGLLGAASLLTLTACADEAAPRGAVSRTAVAASPRPTERTGDTDDTNSGAAAVSGAHQEVLERFDSWVRAQPGVDEHGYIASVDDLRTTSVTLLWHGTDPWRNRLVAAGGRFGVTVRFQQRPQSLAAFTAAQKRLSAAHARFEALGFSLSTISGIAARPQPLTIEGTFARGADRAAVQRLASRVAGERVVVRSGGAAL